MTEDVTLDVVMARRFELVDQQATLAAKHKAELGPIAEELNLCEMFIKDHMNKSGLQQVKTDAGMTFFTTKDSVTVKDMDTAIRFMLASCPPAPHLFDADAPDEVRAGAWGVVLDHIAQHGMWSLLNKAVNKTAAKEQLAAGTTPAALGIEYSAYRDLAWRRGKAE